jgi:hypothetical protein
MTGAYEKIKSKNQLIEILKNGNTFVTNGPMLCLSAGDAIYDSIIGNHGRDFKGDGITIILTSSYEFGEIAAIRVFWGNYASGKESVFFSKKCNKAGFSLHERISISAIKGQKGYLRAEAECRKQDGTISYSATSPFYL